MFSADKNHTICGNINTFQLAANQAQCVANQITKSLDKLLWQERCNLLVNYANNISLLFMLLFVSPKIHEELKTFS